MSLAVALSILQVTIRFGCCTAILRENNLGSNQEVFHLSSSSTREDLRFDEHLECHPAAQALYTYKRVHTFPGFRTQALRHSSQPH
ncbi:hypothetical protein TNCV_3526961 [Trichonephila clavipes]|nr:hypothetical protein TNCV_3526961 [Trichonephila clavipes]